jgi:hypothetical protein
VVARRWWAWYPVVTRSGDPAWFVVVVCIEFDHSDFECHRTEYLWPDDPALERMEVEIPPAP